jgi:hypothetical protein
LASCFQKNLKMNNHERDYQNSINSQRNVLYCTNLIIPAIVSSLICNIIGTWEFEAKPPPSKKYSHMCFGELFDFRRYIFFLHIADHFTIPVTNPLGVFADKKSLLLVIISWF